MSLIDLSNFPPAKQVAIYGNGGRGQALYEELCRCRPDVEVLYYIDSFKSDPNTTPPTLSLEDFLNHKNDVQAVVIATHAVEQVAAALKANCIPNFVIFEDCHILRTLPVTTPCKFPSNVPVFHRSVTYQDTACAATINADFQYDPDFIRAFSINTHERNQDLLTPPWRVHVVLFAAAHAKALKGDFVECGVFRGGLSRAAMEYVDFASMPERTFYLLDTFSGIPDEQLTEEERQLGIRDKGVYNEDWLYDFVVDKFSGFDNVRIIRGMVPNTLPKVTSDAIAYLHIDMNIWQPELAAIEYFWDKLVPGAIVVLDDYGFCSVSWGHHNQKLKFDEFASKKGTQILSLPTGQGMMIKI